MSQQPTEREDRPGGGRGQPPTTRESRSAQGGEPATTREGATPGFIGVLPPELSGDYRQIRQHAESGGEGHLFVVEHLDTGEPRLLKLYHPRITLKPDVLKRVQAIPDRHVVRLYDYGQTAGGQWYEIQEHVEGPNLVEFRDSNGRRLPEPLLRVVIRNLHLAVSAFHSAGLVHRDIKPENILVRHTEPLDLILIDFGLSVVAEGTTVFLSGRDATYNYQAPEILARQAGPAADYWSMGLTIAMLATGNSPYDDMSPHAIHREHLDRVPPLVVDQIGDERVRTICRGLTRYSEENRWGAAEVDIWLRGESPAVVEDASASAPGASVTFNTVDYTDRHELARALLASPAVATSVLKTAARRDGFIEHILRAFGGEAIAELEQRWSARAPRPQEAIAELVVALNPDTPPVYRDLSLGPGELALLAYRAAWKGDTDAQAVVAELAGSRILSAWGRGTVYPELGSTEARWKASRDSFKSAARRAVAAGATEVTDQPVDAMILAALLDDESASRLIRERDRARPRRLSGQDWYAGVAGAGADDLGSVVAGLVYAADAEKFSSEHRERAANEEREQRRERQTQRRQRWARGRTTRLLGIQFAALACVAVAAYIEYDRNGLIGALTSSPVASAGVHVWDFYLRPDWLALVLGIVATLALRAEAGRPGIRYELAATLGAIGGVLYTSGAVTSAIDTRDASALAVLLYATAVLACAWSALDAWIGRTAFERSQSRDRILPQLADRTVVRRTLIATLSLVVPGLIGFAWIWYNLSGVPPRDSLEHLMMASTGNMLLAFVTRGLWVPLAAGTLLLLMRGNWQRRPYGMKASAALAAAVLVGYLVGGAQSEEAVDRTRAAFTTAPIPGAAVDGGFCGRVWTGTHVPSRAAISGPGCDEVRRYHGWDLAWTYRPEGRPDELLSIDGMYLVLWNDRHELTALDSITGDVAWQRSCEDDILWIDESQIDQGVNTPSNQRVIGACGEAEFNLDPGTGA